MATNVNNTDHYDISILKKSLIAHETHLINLLRITDPTGLLVEIVPATRTPVLLSNSLVFLNSPSYHPDF